MNKNFRNKGITLIGLVITIVIMLILTGITINLVFGENGIFTKARNSNIEHIRGELQEQLRMDYQAKKIENEEIDFRVFLEYMKDEKGYNITLPAEGVQGARITKKHGYTIELREDGNIFLAYAGEGPIETGIVIKTKEQLDNIRNNPSGEYVLGANIDLTDFSWVPFEFSGILKGKGYSISNLTVNNSTDDYQGLFSKNSGTISNLSLINVNITGKNYVGGLAGENTGLSISNVKVTGNISSTGYVGGLFGRNYNNGNEKLDINMCIADVTIDSKNSAGYVGGLIGYNESDNSSDGNNGEIIIQKCYSIGEIKGKGYVGGLVAYSERKVAGTNIKNAILNCFSAINMEQLTYGGGLVCNLYRSSIENSYAIGKLNSNANNQIGGLVNRTNNSSCTNSYWATDTTQRNTSSLGISSTMSVLIQKLGYTGFDFEEVWDIEEGETTAYIKGLQIPDEVYAKNNTYVAFEGGLGTEESPYLIKTPDQFNSIRSGGNVYYKLVADIDLGKFENWTPFPSNFCGNLDGDGHTISNLKIDRADQSDIGMFSTLGPGAVIKNFMLKNSSITGKENVGAIFGSVAGYSGKVVIEGIGVKANVTGDKNVGGIQGYGKETNSFSWKIKKCYMTGSVTGRIYIGGILGDYSVNGMPGIVLEDCFNAATINSREGYVGGLAGDCSGDVENCYSVGKVIYKNPIPLSNTDNNDSYWEPQLTGCAVSEYGGTPKPVEELVHQNTYENWDFTNIWEIQEGTTFAYIKGLEIPDEIKLQNINYAKFEVGSGTQESPYNVRNINELKLMGYYNKYFKLTNNINLSGEQWTPIPFVGELDGGGHTISNLTVNNSDEDYQGFIGKNYGSIKNINLTNVNVSGKKYVGGLIGMNAWNMFSEKKVISGVSVSGTITGTSDYVGGLIGYSTRVSNNSDISEITKCSVKDATVKGVNQVGGLIGYNYLYASSSKNTKLTIDRCCSTGAVSGASDIGGLIGKHHSYDSYGENILKNSYSWASVTASVSNVGGLIGKLERAKVSNCYATGLITTSSTSKGGLMGYISSSSITDSYWDYQTTGYNIAPAADSGMTKRSTAQMKHASTSSYYKNWDFTNIWKSNATSGYPTLR